MFLGRCVHGSGSVKEQQQHINIDIKFNINFNNDRISNSSLLDLQIGRGPKFLIHTPWSVPI